MTKLKSRGIALGAALLATTAAAPAFAAGTAAGTSISNSIDVSYVSGGETISVTGADSVSFVVDRRVDLSLEGQDSGKTVTAAAGSNDQILTYLLTNEGNAASGYDLDITVDVASTLGLTYDPTGAGTDGTYYTVLSSDNALDAGDTIVDLTGAFNTVDLAADGQTYVLLVANILGSTTDGLQDIFTVTATALETGTDNVTVETASGSRTLAAEDTIFANAGTTPGVEEDTETLIITAPQLTFTKTMLVIDENLDGSMTAAGCLAAPVPGTTLTGSVPGSCIEYTITATNDASATSAASTLTVTDVMPSDVTYAGDSDGDFDTVTYDAPTDTVTGTLSTLAAGGTASFTIRALVK